MPQSRGWTPVVKGLFSRHLPGADDVPNDPRTCCIEVTVCIGSSASEGADDFDLWFVTPSWLAQHSGEPIIPEYMVIVDRFEWAAVEAAIQRLVSGVPAADWEEFAQEFGRYAHWEFSWRPPRFFAS